MMYILSIKSLCPVSYLVRIWECRALHHNQ